MNIVLIDDHEIFRIGLKSLIETEADLIVVGEACDGSSGLKVISTKLPDVVILDYAMPGLSGLDLLSSVKQKFPKTKIILLTASISESVLAEAINSGADALILKKDSSNELIGALRSVNRGKQVMSTTIAPIIKRFDKLATLTKRERQILRMIAKGYRNREIAEVLNVSLKTVDTHRTNLMRKLNLHSLVDIVEFANKAGINDPYI